MILNVCQYDGENDEHHMFCYRAEVRFRALSITLTLQVEKIMGRKLLTIYSDNIMYLFLLIHK